ncbi:MAG TPA: TonB-dependent receptor [Bacteroidales bacterium]|nr:TonB-dependent receptor [Bacteroidales bacterium]
MKQISMFLALFCMALQGNAQFVLKGTVTDTGKNPLTGAHIVLKDTNYKTTADNQGNFSFTGIKKGKYLMQVTFVGFENVRRSLVITRDTELVFILNESAVVSDVVIVSAVRASQNTPTTFTTLDKETLTRRNLAQDLPYLLNQEPSVVVTSDAGAGVGYTGLRIRGSDITRINVTINGIPLNDPESHAVYWVDVPDFASSVNSLQLQRGVGSSTNGAGAFGASMNLETNSIRSQPFGMINASYGSFNTYKTTVQAGTGLIRDHWYFEGRASAIGSDGYIDRAGSALNSWFMQGGYTDDKTLIKAILISGKEKTYQAWYGVDEYTLESDRTFNWAGAIFEDDGSIRFYDNQTDNYQQDHYQLHLSRQLTKTWGLNLSGHYTYGRGYYEEYNQGEFIGDYGLQAFNDSIATTDLIRRRWLDNHFYGITWSIRNKHEKTDILLGGSMNKYDNARHFGEVIWAEYASPVRQGDHYYDNTAFKTDFNAFLKAAWTPLANLTLYGDMQYRIINYRVSGVESHGESVDINEKFNFFNPKIGASYESEIGTLYASYSIAHREPIRDDYIDAAPGEKPEPESLGNLELGLRKTASDLHYSVNFFLMNYINQLILTGEINDDGAYIRKNVGKSYRTGIELSAGYRLNTLMEIDGNLSVSTGKTDYRQMNSEGTIENFDNVDILFSPRLTGAAQLRLFPAKNLEFDWLLKYVSKQYLDNTGNENLVLDDYLINDVRICYTLNAEKFPDVEFSLLVNNLFNKKYESNGFVWDNTPYFYPQAGTNLLAGISVRF